jgi:hypothetical protein
VVLLALPVALTGVYATGDLCEPIAAPNGSVAVGTGFDDTIPNVLTTCEYQYPDGTEIEATKFNSLGTIAALAFMVGAFFGAAGLLRLIDFRGAVIITGACVLICVTMVVLFFA